jgi:MGT family glycosyltransferase
VSKIAFLSQASVGHVNTLLVIALQMKDDGNNIEFILPVDEKEKINIQIFQTARSIIDKVSSTGIKVLTVRPAVSTAFDAFMLPFAKGYDEVKRALSLFSRGIEHYVENILSLLKNNKPDALVSDFSFFSAHIVAELLNIPYINVYHSGLPFRGKGVPPFGSGLAINTQDTIELQKYQKLENKMYKKLDETINKAREKFGLQALEPNILSYPYSKWLNLIVSHEIMEVPRDVTQNTLFVGPCFGGRKNLESSSFPFEKLNKDSYKIYVSLGTVFNKKPKVFLKIINALNKPGVQLIISAGGSYQYLQEQKIPDNTLIFKQVPQVDLLPMVDLVIGHGGNNSTNETLSSGKPLIVLPVGGEQRDNASRVVYLGAGLKLDIDNFSEEDLWQKVDEIRKNPNFKPNCEKIKNAVNKTDGPRIASKCIQWVIERRTSLNRPDGFPLTVTKENFEQLLN